MVSKELKIHLIIVIFVLVTRRKIKEKFQEKKISLKHTNLKSAIKPVAYFEEQPVPLYTTFPDVEEAQNVSMPNIILNYRINKEAKFFYF